MQWLVTGERGGHRGQPVVAIQQGPQRLAAREQRLEPGGLVVCARAGKTRHSAPLEAGERRSSRLTTTLVIKLSRPATNDSNKTVEIDRHRKKR
jgi:hypothetical protein